MADGLADILSRAGDPLEAVGAAWSYVTIVEGPASLNTWVALVCAVHVGRHDDAADVEARSRDAEKQVRMAVAKTAGSEPGSGVDATGSEGASATESN